MTLPPKIADALKRIYVVVEKKEGIHVLNTSEIKRMDRELLIRTHWLEEISRGWYLLTRPDVPEGDSTHWYANFWDFLKVYLEYHYGTYYCLSAEYSIDLHHGDLSIPKQVIAIANKASGHPLSLPYKTSLLVYSDPTGLPKEKVKLQGLQVMSLPYALCRVSPSYFTLSPQKAEIALLSNQDVAGLLDVMIQMNLKSAAERLIGAYQFLGKDKIADDLRNGLLAAGMLVRGQNPFHQQTPLLQTKGLKSPYSLRIEAMWANYRQAVIDNFPVGTSLENIDTEDYLQHVHELYTQDAYHSLSIEGYQVSRDLLEKVQNGLWDPDNNPQDNDKRNGLAARGYFEAFQKVKESIAKIFNGRSPGEVVHDDLPIWFQQLFGPSVRAGLLRPSDLFGWRRHQVYICGSRHTPPANHYLIDAMESLFQCIQNEENGAVRAILGHFLFVYIHPYMDGNGRIARFLMNAMLASGGYPWTTIPVEKRKEYFAALEMSREEQTIVPFTQFLAERLGK